MREVGVESIFASPDVEFSVGHLNIQEDCERRLLDIEHDLGSSVCTFEAVQWAISELRRMELQERYFVPDDHMAEDETDGASLARSSHGKGRKIAGGEAPDILQPALFDLGKKDPPEASWCGIKSENESLDESLIKKRTHQVEESEKVYPRNWGHVSKATSGGKRLPEASGNEGEKRARVRESALSSVSKEEVIVADHGEAGKRMAERISSRLAIPECTFLTNLVSHCLLVSMDQVPVKSIQNSSNGSTKGDWMWLHHWLVGIVMSDAGDDDPFASLDWLIAFMTATRQSLIAPILKNLASDLLKREMEGSATLSSYMRRTGVLEYAALRDPERTFGTLRPLFPPVVYPTPESKGDVVQPHGGGDELWQGWLGLMVLCPRLFGAFSRLCIPTLSVEELKSWRMNSETTTLPAIWTILLDTNVEEPRTTTEWLYAALMRRLPEIAPVASSLVLLLSGLDETSTDRGTNQGMLGFGHYILTLVYKELSKHVLPKVLGRGQDFSTEVYPEVDKSGEDSGIILFMGNLKQHSHVLWRKALEYYSTSKCTCCEIPCKEALQLESSCRSEAGNDLSMCVESSEVGGGTKAQQEWGTEVQRGCLYRDPLIQLCHLTFLCCTEHVVAVLLANASLVRPCAVGCFEAQSLRRLLMVMRMMRIVSGQGRGALILELWAQQMTDHATVASDEQALEIILAMRQLVDPTFWQNYDILLGSSSQLASAIPIAASEEDAAGHQGLSWKLVWRGLRKVLDVQWLHILPLMHRDGAWELRLAVLGVLQFLNPDGTTRPQAVADRLKGVLGLYFSWLELYDGCDDKTVAGQTGTTAPPLKSRWRWWCARAMEHLKSIIVELASSSFPSFTLMVSCLLDFSFEHNTQISSNPSASSSSGQLVAELSATPLRKVGSASRSSFCVAPLSTGKLDRYGKLILISGPASDLRSSTGSLQEDQMELTEENRRIQSESSLTTMRGFIPETGASPSLQPYERERATAYSQNKDSVGQNATSLTPRHPKRDLPIRSRVVDAELGSLLHRTVKRAISKSVELIDAWPCHPVNVLATHMADRLETPHEVSMTMEQYEEVLPKHISSIRHIFLTDCFSQNPILMEIVELIVRHGGNRAILRCVEFVRVLLADSISSWYNAFRTRWPHSLPQAKVDEEEMRNRMQVSRLIQLVASANWLPQPLAASGEIVAVIDGADIADLLLLVWRCMHHAMAFGPKAWGESSHNMHATGIHLEGQGMSTTGSGDEDAAKEGTYTEWESHFFAILRRNVSKVGAHFAQVYPIRKAL